MWRRPEHYLHLDPTATRRSYPPEAVVPGGSTQIDPICCTRRQSVRTQAYRRLTTHIRRRTVGEGWVEGCLNCLGDLASIIKLIINNFWTKQPIHHIAPGLEVLLGEPK